jgi:RND family efflux transporter MFP subunit
VTYVLDKWSADIASASTDSAKDLVLKSKSNLAVIKSFMTNLAVIVNQLTSVAALSQAQINADTEAMNSGLSALSSAISSLSAAGNSISSAENSLSQAKSAYNLKLAGNSADSIAAQQAKVDQAQAGVNQGVIVSPIDGIVTKADPTEGEFVSSGNAGFAVQNNNFKIEANVPEADIAKVALDDMASSTLDAYGSDVDFPARVVAINPAETVIEGVPTYKVTLEFANPDSRIRSGMTANLLILTHKQSAVLLIPYRAITDDNGKKSVNKVNPDGKTYQSVPVSVGLKGSDGNVEIISGISSGDKVVTYIKQ